MAETSSSGWGDALVGVAGSLISGLIGSNAASGVNKAYQQGGQQLINQANLITGQQRDLYKPYSEYGGQALNALAAFNEAAARGDYSAITEMPEYKFAQQQGQSDLARNLAARGGLFGGQAQKQFMDYNQALAGNQIQNYLNRLQGGVQTGLAGTAGQFGALSNQLGANTSALEMQILANAGKSASKGSNWQSAIMDMAKALSGNSPYLPQPPKVG